MGELGVRKGELVARRDVLGVSSEPAVGRVSWAWRGVSRPWRGLDVKPGELPVGRGDLALRRGMS